MVFLRFWGFPVLQTFSEVSCQGVCFHVGMRLAFPVFSGQSRGGFLRISSYRSLPGLVWVIGPLIWGAGHGFGVFGARFSLLMVYLVLVLFFVSLPPAWGAGGDSGKAEHSQWGKGLHHVRLRPSPFPSKHFAPRPPHGCHGDGFHRRIIPAPTGYVFLLYYNYFLSLY